MHVYLPEEGRLLTILQGGKGKSAKASSAIQQTIVSPTTGIFYIMTQDKQLTARQLDGTLVRYVILKGHGG